MKGKTYCTESEINSMLDRYGEYWILRDLDYLPEKISDLCRHSRDYLSVWERIPYLVQMNKWAAFKHEIEAIEASISVQCVLGLEVPETLIDKKHKIQGELNQEVNDFKKNLEVKYGKETVGKIRLF